MIIPITNQSKNFYAHLGRIFGSREVQRNTGDRFYDDDDKTWYLYFSKGAPDTPDTFVSIKNHIIKNVWSEDSNHLVEVLKEIKANVGESLAPKCFKEEYEKADYTIIENGSKNFMKIVGDYIEKED